MMVQVSGTCNRTSFPLEVPSDCRPPREPPAGQWSWSSSCLQNRPSEGVPPNTPRTGGLCDNQGPLTTHRGSSESVPITASLADASVAKGGRHQGGDSRPTMTPPEWTPWRLCRVTNVRGSMANKSHRYGRHETGTEVHPRQWTRRCQSTADVWAGHPIRVDECNPPRKPSSGVTG